jgi:hypothetical protein
MTWACVTLLVWQATVEDLEWELLRDGDGQEGSCSLRLSFTLRSGSYATIMLRELFKHDEPAARDAEELREDEGDMSIGAVDAPQAEEEGRDAKS